MQRHQLHACNAFKNFQYCALKLLIRQYSRKEPEMENVKKKTKQKMYAKKPLLI